MQCLQTHTLGVSYYLASARIFPFLLSSDKLSLLVARTRSLRSFCAHSFCSLEQDLLSLSVFIKFYHLRNNLA